MTPAEMGERATATAIAEAMLTTQLRLYPGQMPDHGRGRSDRDPDDLRAVIDAAGCVPDTPPS